MTLSDDLMRARAIAWKDLVAERRGKANFNGVLSLALLLLLLFGFSLGPDAETMRAAAAGLLWLTVLLSGVMAFNRSYEVELEGGALDVLLGYPGARWPILAGKVAANLAFVLAIEAVVIPIAAVLYHVNILPRVGTFVAIVLLGTLGFVTLGTLYGAVASRGRAREVVLPVLLFPMLVPVLIAATKATGVVLIDAVDVSAGPWLRLLAAFDVIFVAAAFLLFDDVIGA